MPCADLKPEPVPPNRELPRAGSCFSPTETALGIGAVGCWPLFIICQSYKIKSKFTFMYAQINILSD